MLRSLLWLGLIAPSWAVAGQPVGAWSAQGTGTLIVQSDGSDGDPSMTYNQVGTSGEWSFTARALADTTMTLPYTYEGFHGFFQSTATLHAIVIHNGVETATPLRHAGPQECCTAPSSLFSYHDTVQFTVEQGDTLGFRFSGSHDDSDNRLQGWFTVSETGLPSTDRDCIGADAFGRSDTGDLFCDDLDACAGADLIEDSDADSVCDVDDICPDGNDTVDSDDDGIPDDCDECPTDASGDSDGDGVCDGEDQCSGEDDRFDADSDGIPDGCDLCPNSFGGDADSDGVCDLFDACPGFSDDQDADFDGVPDGCDDCPQDLFDDSDNDGVCDSDDLCVGFPDDLDINNDGVPDDCENCAPENDRDGDGVCDDADPCPDDLQDDSDNDGVCDSDDICQGMRDSIDMDNDGIPDGCDTCPDDPNNDVDGDTVCAAQDICEDGDDTVDRDQDGTPDDCDPCPDDLADRCLQTQCVDCDSTDVNTLCMSSGGPWTAVPGIMLLLAMRRRRRVTANQLR